MSIHRLPFGINRFKSYNWRPNLKLIRACALFYFLFEIFEFEGSGFILMTICLWHRALQIQLPFPAHKIKKRGAWRFPKRQLLKIEEPNASETQNTPIIE